MPLYDYIPSKQTYILICLLFSHIANRSVDLCSICRTTFCPLKQTAGPFKQLCHYLPFGFVQIDPMVIAFALCRKWDGSTKPRSEPGHDFTQVLQTGAILNYKKQQWRKLHLFFHNIWLKWGQMCSPIICNHGNCRQMATSFQPPSQKKKSLRGN